MYLEQKKAEEESAAARRPSQAPGRAAPEIDAVRARPLMKQYALASGWSEVAHEWCLGDLLEAHRICDFIDHIRESQEP